MLKHFILCTLSHGSVQKKKKKKLAKAVPQPVVNDASIQMPAVRCSDDPVISQVPHLCLQL